MARKENVITLGSGVRPERGGWDGRRLISVAGKPDERAPAPVPNGLIAEVPREGERRRFVGDFGGHKITAEVIDNTGGEPSVEIVAPVIGKDGRKIPLYRRRHRREAGSGLPIATDGNETVLKSTLNIADQVADNFAEQAGRGYDRASKRTSVLYLVGATSIPVLGITGLFLGLANLPVIVFGGVIVSIGMMLVSAVNEDKHLRLHDIAGKMGHMADFIKDKLLGEPTEQPIPSK